MLMTLLQANYLSLFNWVLTTSAKASIFIVFLLGVKYVLRHRMRARFQYMLWSVLIIGLVLPWTPSSPVSINNLVNSSYIQQVLAPSSNSTTQPMTTVVDNKQSSLEQTAVVNSNSSKAVLGTDTQLTGSSNNVAPFAILPFIYKLIFLIWLVGILLLTAITVLVNIRFSNKIEHNLVTDPRLITVFNQLKVELKIKAEISLVKTRHVNSPSLLGFVHPRLLLPLGIEQTFNVEQIKHIFLHELLHFRRKDILINWLTQVLVIIHWFNPLIWYAFYRMREDQEIACDALAIERIDTEQSNDYAYTLIKLVETYSNAPRLAGLASLSGSKSQIRRRLTMIKDSRSGSVRWSVLGFLVIVLIASAVFTGVKYENAKPSVKINNMEQAKQYLESHAFDDISMMEFYSKVFVYNNSSGFDQKMKLEDFKIGLDTNYKVRVMSMKVIDTSNAELKSYSIQYDRDSNYFNVTEKQGAENQIWPAATEVLTRLDKYKNRITFPKGDYSYYYFNFYLSGSIGPGVNLYALNDEGLHLIKDRSLEGLIFMVYGDPIKKEDYPSFYIMPY